jgi:nicotinamide mononucleotide transporter
MGNFILQFLFVVQSLLGWYNWNKKDQAKIDWLQNSSKLLFLPILYTIVVIFTIKSGSTLPYLDSITTTLSITAMFLIAYRKIEGWLFWIAVDSVSIYMFYILGLYLSSFIYFIFLILATSGLIKWIKNYGKEV